MHFLKNLLFEHNTDPLARSRKACSLMDPAAQLAKLKAGVGGVTWHEAVDEMAALEFDDTGMNTRMRLVEAGVCGELVAALDVMDTSVRCKAANALGCLCANKDALEAVVG